MIFDFCVGRTTETSIYIFVSCRIINISACSLCRLGNDDDCIDGLSDDGNDDDDAVTSTVNGDAAAAVSTVVTAGVTNGGLM